MRFEGKAAVVTGAASGLGRAVAMALHREGAARIVMLDRNAEGLRKAADAVGSSAVAHPCDVSDAGAVAQAVSDASLPDGLDVLVTAAGILGPYGSAAECSPREWEEVFATNVHGTYLAIHHGLPLIRRRGGGAIVTFGSVAGLAGSALRGAYSATKGAVVMMTRSLALVHAREGIRINCVCPGPVLTPMADASWSQGGGPDGFETRKAAALARTPSGRFGTADEVAETVLFLASDAAAHITGIALPIDGGRLA